MGSRETGTVVSMGTSVLAPVYMPREGNVPVWSGKKVFELSERDIDAVHEFCMEEAWNIGFEDGVDGIEERANPFHRQFMQGVPFSVFMMYYMRGRSASQRSSAQMAGLCDRARGMVAR